MAMIALFIDFLINYYSFFGNSLDSGMGRRLMPKSNEFPKETVLDYEKMRFKDGLFLRNSSLIGIFSLSSGVMQPHTR